MSGPTRAVVALLALACAASPVAAQDGGRPAPEVDRPSPPPEPARARRTRPSRPRSSAAPERATDARPSAEAAAQTLRIADPADVGGAEPATADGEPTPPLESEAEPALAVPPGQTIDDAGARLGWDGGVPAAPDAGVDAGMPDAGVPAPPDAGFAAAPDAGALAAAPTLPSPARDEGAAWLTLASELLFERAEREEREGRRAPEPTPEDRVTPVRVVDPVPVSFGLALPERTMSTFGLIVLALFALLALWTVGRVRRGLAKDGLLPRAVGTAQLALRVVAGVTAVMVLARLLPSWLRPYLFLVLAAAALAAGFVAVSTVLPDAVAGLILLAERRVRAGLWLTCGDLQGEVERVRLRVTVLRSADGTHVALPNRLLLKSTTHTTSRHWPAVDVELSVPPGRSAMEVRRAIADAVLCSAFVPSDPLMLVARDPRRPARWRLRARILDAKFAARFEGQLLEHVEGALSRPVEAGSAAATSDGEDAPSVD